MRTVSNSLSQQASPAKKVLAVLGIAFSVFYLANPTSGIVELIPDVIPGIGHLDEVTIMAFLVTCWKVFKQD